MGSYLFCYSCSFCVGLLGWTFRYAYLLSYLLMWFGFVVLFVWFLLVICLRFDFGFVYSIVFDLQSLLGWVLRASCTCFTVGFTRFCL